MKLQMAVLCSLVSVSIGYPREVMAGNITGTVTGDSPSGPIEDIQVDFLDALNADLLGSTYTSIDGTYDSGPLPDGNCRVKFSDPLGHAPGFFIPGSPPEKLLI